MRNSRFELNFASPGCIENLKYFKIIFPYEEILIHYTILNRVTLNQTKVEALEYIFF